MTERTSLFATSSLTSADGTVIGYRQVGHGAGTVLVHGAGQAGRNFAKLAMALADTFTVYVPDRRGRGLSGPHGTDYSITKECDDLAALLRKTGAANVFGLSSGALIALQTALLSSQIHRLALYEPPLPVAGTSPAAWLPRYDWEIAQGKLGAALVTAVRGTQTGPRLFSVVPRVLLDPVLTVVVRHAPGNPQARRSTPPRASPPSQPGVLPFLVWLVRRLAPQSQEEPRDRESLSLKALLPTLHYDATAVTNMHGALETFKEVRSAVLLLGGSKSPSYLKAALDALETVLPHVTRVDYAGADHLAADNSGTPEVVAETLTQFFRRA